MTAKADETEKTNRPQIVNLSDYSDNDTINMIVQFAPGYAAILLKNVDDEDKLSAGY